MLREVMLTLSITGLAMAASGKGPAVNAYDSQLNGSKLFDGVTEECVTFFSRESLDSEARLARKAVVIKRPDAKATVLICHGFKCDKYDVSFLHMLFNEYNSMAFDFRAHGEEKEGQCCTFGRDESYDVIAAVEHIKNDPELRGVPLIAYGFSMGAASAIIAQARDRNLFDAMILDCPFDSSDKLLDRGLAQLKVSVFGYEMPMPGSGWLKSYGYSPYVQSALKNILKTFTNFGAEDIVVNFVPVFPEEAIKYVEIPCFFIGCINDQKAPEEAVLKVYEGAKGFKRCWIDTDGRKHYDTIFRQMHQYFYEVDRFIKIILDGSYKKTEPAQIRKDKPECILTPGNTTTPTFSKGNTKRNPLGKRL